MFLKRDCRKTKAGKKQSSVSIPKIICSLGTSTDDEAVLREMVGEGMACARINTAYSTVDHWQKRIRLLRSIAPVPVMLDLKGSQIRILTNNKKYRIDAGDEFSVAFQKGEIAFNHDFSRDLSSGDQVLIENGTIKTMVVKKKPEYALLKVLDPGEGHLTDRMGVNVPGKMLESLPLFMNQDFEYIELALKEKVEFLAMSFCRTSKALAALHEEIVRRANGKQTQITPVVKIEDPVGVKNLPSIVEKAKKRDLSLKVMIGRGDLFVEAPIEELPFLQKRMVAVCHELSVEAIVATGLLESMQYHPFPTRAEVCDVANAVLDGADWLMLSGETANSKYPVEAVKMMRKIIVRYSSHEERGPTQG